jgi:hypothetical protein
MAGDEWRTQARCPACQRFTYPGARHLCKGDLRRCANPRCRRLLPWFPRRELCARCAVLAALDGALPPNTYRKGR